MAGTRRLAPSLALVVLLLVLLGLAAFFALAWHRPVAEINPPPPTSFSRALVKQGEMLAAAGDCASCHTTREGPSFAGGVPLTTPFGTIYGTNITPERETGIGAWSEEAFRRALREGVSRDGHLLYPAFPYNHFTHLTDQDIGALYAFMMTRDPVHAPPRANQLSFPLQFRPLVAGWNQLYLDKGPLPQQQASASQTPEWKRGAYLVNSAAHCAACHSTHNRLGAEEKNAFLAGGDIEGWRATALNAQSPSPVAWTVESLAAYLRTGLVPDHAMTAGPMAGVVHNLSQADPADVHAMATYIISIMGAPTAERQSRESAARARAGQDSLAAIRPATPAPASDEATLALGAQVYQGSCAGCHDMGRQYSSNTALRLPLAVALYLPDPRNLLHIIREGIQPADGDVGRWMPPFEGSLTDEQLSALVVWLRRQGADAQPWTDVPRIVKETGNAP